MSVTNYILSVTYTYDSDEDLVYKINYLKREIVNSNKKLTQIMKSSYKSLSSEDLSACLFEQIKTKNLNFDIKITKELEEKLMNGKIDLIDIQTDIEEDKYLNYKV